MAKERESSVRGVNENLSDFYKSWGAFDIFEKTLDQLPPDWLKILNIARNLLDGKRIPGVNLPSTVMALVEKDQEIVFEKRYMTRKWQQKSILPATSIDVKNLEDLSQLPKVLPAHLLLQGEAPEIFAYRALTHSLPIAEMQKPRAITEEKSETLMELVPKARERTSMRQRVYALMDVSLSMKSNYKLIFSKAVMLAYLAKAHEEGSEVYFRAFAGSVGDLVACISPEDFPALAKRILGYRVYHGTDIRYALTTAVEDISRMERLTDSRRAKTEVLLISDGESYTPIPLMPKNIALHTLHLVGGGEEFILDKELRQMSNTYTRIDTGNLMLPSISEEAWFMFEEIERLEDQTKGLTDSEMKYDRRLQQRVEAIRKHTEAYRKIDSSEKVRENAGRAQKLHDKVSLEKAEERLKKKLELIRYFIKKLMQKIKSFRLPKFDRKKVLAGSLFDFRIKD